MMLQRDRAGELADPGPDAHERRVRFRTHLGWIAKQLKRTESFYFRDYLTSWWIPDAKRRRLVNAAVGAIAGLVAALSVAALLVPDHPVAGTAIATGLFALFFGVRLGNPKLPLADTARTARPRGSWSLQEFRRGFRRPLGWVTIAGALYDGVILQRRFAGWTTFDADQRRGALLFALFAVLAVGSLCYLQGWRLEMIDTDNWAVGPAPQRLGRFVARSLLWAAYAGAGLGLLATLLLAAIRLIGPAIDMARGEPGRPLLDLLASLWPALNAGLLTAAVVFLTVLVMLLSLRADMFLTKIVLREDNDIPDDYAVFLARATELALIQRTGGNEYMFSHPLLREHFALDRPLHDSGQ